MPNGEIEPRQVKRLKEIGQWLGRYGETIYGTRGGPFPPGPWGASTSKQNTVYVHVLQWEKDRLILPAIRSRIIASSALTGGTPHVRQTGENIEISMPPAQRQEIDTIVVLQLDQPAREAFKKEP